MVASPGALGQRDWRDRTEVLEGQNLSSPSQPTLLCPSCAPLLRIKLSKFSVASAQFILTQQRTGSSLQTVTSASCVVLILSCLIRQSRAWEGSLAWELLSSHNVDGDSAVAQILLPAWCLPPPLCLQLLPRALLSASSGLQTQINLYLAQPHFTCSPASEMLIPEQMPPENGSFSE